MRGRISIMKPMAGGEWSTMRNIMYGDYGAAALEFDKLRLLRMDNDAGECVVDLYQGFEIVDTIKLTHAEAEWVITEFFKLRIKKQPIPRSLRFGGHDLTIKLVNKGGDVSIKIDGESVIYYDAEQDGFGVLKTPKLLPIKELMKKYRGE